MPTIELDASDQRTMGLHVYRDKVDANLGDDFKYVTFSKRRQEVLQYDETQVEPVPTEAPAKIQDDLRPLVRLKPPQSPVVKFNMLQQWEGTVTDVEDGSFWATLHDLTDPSRPVESAEFPFSEVPDEDKPLVAAGGVFYWSIGYWRSDGGQIRRISEIRVRRTPLWSKSALERVEDKAQELRKRFSRSHDSTQI